jgi:hypothetical protein
MKTAAFNTVTPILALQKEQSHNHEQLKSAATLLSCQWYVPIAILGALASKICKMRLLVSHSQFSDQTQYCVNES